MPYENDEFESYHGDVPVARDPWVGVGISESNKRWRVAGVQDVSVYESGVMVLGLKITFGATLWE
jgi:hypothetical protein